MRFFERYSQTNLLHLHALVHDQMSIMPVMLWINLCCFCCCCLLCCDVKHADGMERLYSMLQNISVVQYVSLLDLQHDYQKNQCIQYKHVLNTVHQVALLLVVRETKHGVWLLVRCQPGTCLHATVIFFFSLLHLISLRVRAVQERL